MNGYKNAPLLDAYDVYQHLMDYWAQTMQDDCYLIAADGWKEAAQLKLIIDDKKNKTKVKPDLVIGKKKYLAELLPPALIIARYFADEQAEIDTLESDSALIVQQIEEITEEHGSEEGLLADALNDRGKLTKVTAASRLKEIKKDADAAEERKVLQQYLDLVEQDAELTTTLNQKQYELTEKVLAKYPKLSIDEIKTLVVDDKWLSALDTVVQGELDRVSQTLTSRIRELAERYETPLPEIVDEVATLSVRVDEHLKKMGIVWN